VRISEERAALTKSQDFVAIDEIMANRAENFRLQFLDVENTTMLEERSLCAVDVNDAAREAAFRAWPIGAQSCRIASLDGQEIASVGRVRPVRPEPPG
jgi:hypothetical protein